ncbi:phosphoenolpyruvate synthase, partial [Vibrio vulnificus]
LEAGQAPIVKKTFGSKLSKMIYANSQVIGKQVEIVDTSEAERNQFSLTDAEIVELAKQAMIIEKHYQRPMDIEWAKDGIDGQLYIVQARPETVCSQSDANVIERYELSHKAEVLIEGRAIG